MTSLRESIAIAIVTMPFHSHLAFAQDIPFDLGTLVLEGERSDRPLDEAPASIAAIDGEQATQPSNLDIRDVADQTPNVIFDNTGFLPSVRGIDGSSGASAAFITGSQPRVNVIIDGVTRPSTVNGSFGTISSLWDTEQVEIARGPQSTLGGRNSLGGNIRVQTNDPVHFVEGAARVFAFSDDGTIGTALTLNTPIIQDQLAFRFTAEAATGNSFIDPDPSQLPREAGIDDEEDRRYRAKLLFTPEALPGLRVVATAEHIRRLALVSNIVMPGTFTEGFGTAIDNEQTVFGINASYEFGNSLTLEGRLSYLNNESETPFGLVDATNKDISGEILLRGEDIGRVNRFVVGASFDRQKEEIDGDPVSFAISADGEIETLGVYGEIDFALTDSLALIAGGRIEHDDRSRDLVLFGAPASNSVSETAFIPKFGLRYDVNEDVSIGYQYSEGFRAGGLTFDFFDPAGSASTFDSERLRQHEIYTRSTFMDGRATLNASAFYYEFDDAQVVGAAVAPSGAALIGNIPRARGFGAEIDGSYSFGNGLTVSGGLGLLDTKITDAGPNVPQFEGADLPRAPSLNANLQLSYVSENGFDAFARVRHVASADFVLGDGGTQDAYTLVDVGLGYDFDIGNGRTFSVDAFVNNVFDQRVVVGVASFNGDEYVERPRTIGISGTIRF